MKNTDNLYQGPIQSLAVETLRPFQDHPLRLYPDEKMNELAQSIRENGVITPILVRPLPSGGYEIVSGHNRVEACKRAGLSAIPAIVREMDDDTATLLMVDANQQRESIMPSEKAFAYKMRLDAMKRQGKRPVETCTQPGYKSGEKSADRLAREVGESRNQIQRHIRLTFLIPELRDLVDSGKLALNPAVELSYLPTVEQTHVLTAMESEQCAPTLAQAQAMRQSLSDGTFTCDTPLEILVKGTGKRKEVLTLPMDRFAAFFPPDSTPRQIQEELFRILTAYRRKQEKRRTREQER